MPETDIDSTSEANIAGAITDYSVDAQQLDSPGDQQETTWQNTQWTQQLGYYKEIPELKIAIDAKATWTIGAGFTADEQTTLLLMTIKGNGKDSFNSILKNAIKVKHIGGDSYAEIIRDNEDILVNLKPLNPGNIVIVQNRQGRIIRYEQTTRKKWYQVWKKGKQTFRPDQIFHLSRERIGDEMHGISVIPAVKWIILARNEAMTDWKKVLHRNVSPFIIWHLDNDDPAQIAAFKAKRDSAAADQENIYIPKGAVVPEIVSVAANATLNPTTWINQLNDYFFQAVNVPQIIIGNSKEFTEASGKIVYLAYEQSVKAEQLYIEEQVLGQLNLEIQLTFPASMQNELITDEGKDPALEASKPNDEQVEIEGKT